MTEQSNLVAQDKEWAKYQMEKVKSNYPKWPNEVMVKLLFGDYLEQRPKLCADWNVLDVGCGFGNNLVPFLEMGMQGFGVEIHNDMVQVTRKALNDRGYKADVRVGSNRALPFDDESFDLLISVNALHYEENQTNINAALAEFSRVLKPGGFCFISTVGPEHDIYRRAHLAGQHQYQIRDWDFRDGQSFYFFDNANYLKYSCEQHFSNVEVARSTEQLIKYELDFLLAICRK